MQLLGGLFSGLVDYRKANHHYEQEPLLCGLLLAILSGATSLRKMELFLQERLERLNALFGTNWKKAPTWVGIRRFLLTLDVAAVEDAVRRQAARQRQDQAGRRWIAMDGKALRGSASRVQDQRARQLVAALSQEDLIILGHVEVDDKSNEIPAVQSLIESLEVAGDIITLDALHCQKKTLACARAKQADVLVQVKDNQPELLSLCGLLPGYCDALSVHEDHDKGHGRVETRTVTVFIPPENWLPEGWQPMVKAVVSVRREIWHKRKGVPETSEETAWWISTVVLSAQQCQEGIRGHWSIENQNHHVRDVVLLEDACRTREQPGIGARLRSMALNCLRNSGVHNISHAIYRNALNFEYLLSCVTGQN